MKAVNLIPLDSTRSGSGQARALAKGPGIIVLGLLAVALGLVTVYVLTQNTIADRKAKIAAEQVQLAAVKVQVAKLNNYSQFEQLAQARIQTIREIATSRFDWHAALSSLSKVVPPNTSLLSLLGTVSPDASVSGPGGGSGASGSSLRSAIAAPAFELRGCTATQDDVARLMSRLRVMDGVTRVTLSDSQKANQQAGAAVSSSQGQNGAVGCGDNGPTFDLVVFFKPLPGQTSATGSSSSSTTPASTATTSTTPSSTGTSATTQGASTTSTATTPAPTTGTTTGGSR